MTNRKDGGSMKTIEVMEGDEWRKDVEGDIWQVRGKWNRCITLDVIGAGAERGNVEWPKSEPITTKAAYDQLLRWGYTLTPAAKPEAKPITVSPGAREVAAQMQNTPQPKSGFQRAWEVEAKPASPPPAVKENLTTDVPVVDAVWVDHEGVLYQYNSVARASLAWGQNLTNGTARIVRIRSVDEEARDAADCAIRLHQNLKQRVVDLESRLAADKPADKDAARVVKLPDGWWWERAWNQRKQNLEWIAWNSGTPDRKRVIVDDTGDEAADRLSLAKAALASQGIKVEVAE